MIIDLIITALGVRALVDLVAWAARVLPARLLTPAPADDPEPEESVTAILPRHTVTGTCTGCLTEFETPTDRVALASVGNCWHIEGMCLQCGMPWMSSAFDAVEAEAMRERGVPDATALVGEFRALLDADDRGWLTP